MIDELKFYKDYFEADLERATQIKIARLQYVIQDNHIYKFILFDENEMLNESKIEAFQNDMLWFSHYIYLNDPTEFEIKYDLKKVASKANRQKEDIKRLIGILKEMYDVCSFTYCYDGAMWENYANKGNGVCLVFNVNDLDMLFPVDYIPKWKINYNKIIIDAFKRSKEEIEIAWGYNDPLSLLPYVTKNPDNGALNSVEEKEVRILYPTFEEGKVNNGRVYPHVKRDIGYRGINVSYDYCKLALEKIIIGNGCSENIIKQIEDIAFAKQIKSEKRI